MTIAETSGYFAASAEARWRQLRRDPLGFLLLAMMAGAYVGVGILLIFAVGQPADPSWRSLVMGASFGIALTLMVFAGSRIRAGHAEMSERDQRQRHRHRQVKADATTGRLGHLCARMILYHHDPVERQFGADGEGYKQVDEDADRNRDDDRAPDIAVRIGGLTANWVLCGNGFAC